MTADTAILRKDYAAASMATSYLSQPNFDYCSESLWGKAMNTAFGGSSFSNEGFSRRAENSVALNAGKINTPLLLQVVDREYYLTVQNYHALHNGSKPVEMWIFSDEYHIKWQPAHRYNVYRRNLQWFRFWLQGIESDDPVDPSQYERWQAMCKKHCANIKERELEEQPVYCEAA